MAKMLTKTSKHELKNVFVMKLNAQNLNMYKITLPPAKPTSRRRLQSCVTYLTSYKLHHPSNILFLEIFLNFYERIING